MNLKISLSRSLFSVSALLLLSFSVLAQKSILDSLTEVHGSLEGDLKAYNAIKIAKQSIDRITALQYAKEALHLSEADTTKTLALNQMAWEYKNLKHFDSAAFQLNKARELAEQIDYKQGLADIFQTYGSIYSNQSLYDSALMYQEMSMNIQSQLNDIEGMAALYNNMSIIYQNKGEYKKGREVLEKSMALWEKLDRSKEVGDSYLNIGTFYYYVGNLDSCIISFTNALTIYEKEELPNFQVYALANLGIIYMEELNDTLKSKNYFKKILTIENKLNSKSLVGLALNGLGVFAQKNNSLDSALFYFNRALKIHEKNQSLYNISEAKTNIGAVYSSMKEYDIAEGYLNESITLKRRIGDNNGLMPALTILSTINQAKKDYKNASKNLEEAYQLSLTLGNKIEQRDILYERISLYKETGDYQEATKLFDTFLSLKDTILNKDRLLAIEDVKGKYETEKKEQRIVILNQENELKSASLQRNTFFTIGLIILLLLVVLIFYFLRFRARQKHNLVLQEQKIKMRETQMQAVIDSQEQERKRFATDLHDGMGQLVAALQLNIQAMKQSDGDLEKRDELFENSTGLLKEVHKEIRNIAFNLMPQTLTNEGLVPAVRELTKRINKTDQIKIHFSEVDMKERLGEVKEVSLYRIIQEFLSNIMKYSGAKNVYLGLTNHGDEIVLSIEDDGPGYDLNKFKVSEGNGWRNINSRLNLIQGEMEINTLAGRKGSSVMININQEVKSKPSEFAIETEK